MSFNRAEFLKHFAGKIISNGAQLLPIVAPGLGSALQLLEAQIEPGEKKPGLEAPSLPRWIAVGTLADFPPGCRVFVNQGKHLIASHQQGLYALDANQTEQNPRRPLRLECNGQVALNPGGQWPDRSCLSILTGNRISEEEP